MIIGGIIAICIVLLIVAFLAPRLSRTPQREADRALGAGARGGSKAPGPLGRLASKGFHKGQKAVDKSAGTGRRGRRKMPF